jgi:DNA polymerase
VRITIDFETYSEAELKKCGAWRYAEHTTTEILCLAYSINGAEPDLWHPGYKYPAGLLDCINRGAIIDAHNVGFERAIWENVCVKRMGWPEVDENQWDCTMARAASRALPLGLDELTRALGLEQRKDKRGKQLLNLLSKPQKVTKKQPLRRIQDPALLAELYEYCKQDVRAELAVRERLGDLPAPERSVFLLNEKMNSRGITIDVESVHNAVAIVEEVEARLTEELVDLTSGIVTTHNQGARILEWLRGEGVELDDLTADTVAEAIPRAEGSARRVLEIRGSLAKASTKKLQSLLGAVGGDGRVRGLSQYHGAFTGRNAGRLVQPLNLPRPKLDVEPEALIDAISHRSASWLEAMYGDPMQCVADALRPMFMAAEGKNLCSVDLSAIEAVGIAALAGEETKLDVFRRGDDPYCVFASFALGRKVTKATDPKARQEVGKVGELAFGYGGGVGAWRNFDDSDRFTDALVDDFKKAWRLQHPRISTPPWSKDEAVGLWYGLQAAAIKAMLHGEAIFRDIRYYRRGDYLVCVLPSSRSICYYEPRLEERENPYTERSEVVLTYMSQKQGRWARVDTWGGKLAENVTQAACRDILVHGQKRCDPEFPVLMTVYDEIVVEVDEDLGVERPVERMIEYMTEELPPWCATWPIKAAGWCGKRYRKD